MDAALDRCEAGDSDGCLAVLRGHGAAVEGAVFLDDGRALSWSEDGTLRAWGPDGASLLAEDAALSWGRDHTARVWSLSAGRCEAVLRGHEAPVRGGLGAGAGRAVTWSDDRTLRV